MSIFNRDRIGVAVFCRVAREGETRTGYVRWTHAMVGETVTAIESVGNGTLQGPWTVQDVDIPIVFNKETLGNAAIC